MKHPPPPEALSTVFFIAAIALVALAGFNQWELGRHSRAQLAAAELACAPLAFDTRDEVPPKDLKKTQSIGLALTTIAYQSQLAEQQRDENEKKEDKNAKESTQVEPELPVELVPAASPMR